MDTESFIIENTRVASPLLCPEIRLRLITPECALWKATEKDLKAMALPDPYWGFCWAGGQALARHVLDNQALVRGNSVLDFGAGCGVEALAAVMAGAASVTGADIDPLAVVAMRLNAALNGTAIETTTRDLLGDPLDGFDVVLAGDMFYDPAFSRRVLDWLKTQAARGVDVLLGDPGRGKLDDPVLQLLATYMAPADVDFDGTHLRETKIYAVGA